MQTHVKDAVSTTLVFLVLAGSVSTGTLFRLFGVPDVTILGFPFQYFWFVIGGWVSLFVIFWLYHRYATRLDAEKARLRDQYPAKNGEETDDPDAGGESTATAAPGEN